jgi:hypothetical protein
MTALVAPERYLQVTKDSASDNADVTQALADAQQYVQDRTKRVLPYGTWKETCYVYSDGKVYPSATPLDSVVEPQAESSIQGAGIWVGWWNPYPAVVGYNGGINTTSFPPQADITYTGGYQPDGTTDGPTPPLPYELVRAICWIAWRSLYPAVLPNVPAGANSVHVGDVGYSSPKALPTGALTDDALELVLYRYTRKDVRAWSSKIEAVTP